MKKLFAYHRVWLVVFCSIVILSPTITSAKTYHLRFASPFPPMQVTNRTVIQPWIEEIERMSNGRIKIKFFPGGALGKTASHYDLAEKGLADISYHLHDYTPGRFPMTSVYSLPFMTPTAKATSEAMWKTFETESEFRKEYENVKVLALFCHSGGDFFTTEKPIRKVEDFKGLKIRTANLFVNKALKIWGAVPVAMPITEAYQSMERGIVDGAVTVWEGLGVFKLDEVTRYATIADFFTSTMIIVMNKRKWEALPREIQQMIDDTTGLNMSVKAGMMFDEADAPFRKRALEKGIEEILLNDETLKEMEQMTLSMRQQWVKDSESRGLNGQKVLDTALHLLGKK